jgi:nucleoside-diphosphate-sugar epimerase
MAEHIANTEAGSRTVALTGATGFIGSTTAQHLKTAGWQVRALIRRGSEGRLAPGTVTERLEGSLDEPNSLHRLVQGAHAVVHCAGAVRGATRGDFDRVNVEGVMGIAQAAAAQAVKPRFLLLSSLAAREPHLSHYAASKRLGEQALAAEAGTMPWVALRPPAVYGPGDRELLPLFRAMGRGVAPILASPGARVSLLYVEDLAGAVLQWLNSASEASGVFELHDGRAGGYSWRDVMDTAAQVCGRRIVPVPVPAPLLKTSAAISLAISRLTGSAPMLTPGKVRELRHSNWVCDNAAWHQASGWTPRFPLEAGLRLTPGWRKPGRKRPE